jgi:hypothetical protein
VLAVALTALALLAPTVPQGNLLRNPGAEDGQASQSGETTVEIPAWQTTSTFTVVPYGGGGAPDFFTFPPTSESDRIHGGKNFFSGGFRAGTSTATQTVDTSRAATLVDAGRVTATLSAWLSGFLSQPDPGTVEADFMGERGGPLGSVKIGPVTPDERDRDLKFVQKLAEAPVPPGTRTVRVTMTAVQQEGTYDDAYFDNLSFSLNGPTLTLARRCVRKRLVVLAAAPSGLRGLSVTFRLGSKSRTDKKAPFTATFAAGRKPATLLASGVVSVGGHRAVVPGRLIVHCP